MEAFIQSFPSTFFGRPKLPDLTHKTSTVVPLPMRFFLWRYFPKDFLPKSPPTWLYSAHSLPSVLGCYGLGSEATQPLLGGDGGLSDPSDQTSAQFSEASYLVYSGADFELLGR